MSEKELSRNIAIIWDFDGTLMPKDSTTQVAEIIRGKPGFGKDFWDTVKRLTEKTYYNPRTQQEEKSEWEHLLGSDAPAWMFILSRMAHKEKIPLNSEFFREVVVPEIELFPNVIDFLKAVKNIENQDDFKKLNIKIHHFIVSAGLKDLIQEVFPKDLITRVFGCRYAVVAHGGFEDEPESIPVVCMDETMKTRSLFEISKGSFIDSKKPVNKRVEKSDRWALFSDFIYVGDGPTDIPALSLTRYNGGLGVVVHDPHANKKDLKQRLGEMSLDKRADLITPADFSIDGELFQFIKSRCVQIRQRYRAESLN